MKTLAVLGSTGSIGKNTLRVAEHLGYKIASLAVHSNIDLLEEQGKKWDPEVIAVYDKDQAFALQKRLPHQVVVGGMEGLMQAATVPGADIVISAMVGAAGILPTFKAIEAGKTIGLANKEVLIAAGELMMSLARKQGVQILPIDSEHSAIFQCLQGEDIASVRRLILTASGGPFRGASWEELRAITPRRALDHPTWKMGKKITIDSSTLMNKGLEVIEAHFLFDQPLEKIDVVIHPQSIIHSFVEFIDGSLMAQMGEHDMQIPIQYALTYPERKNGLHPCFDFAKYSTLEFSKPDLEKFPCLRLAYRAAKVGGTLPCFMNAANEVLVEQFLAGKISWIDIGKKLETLMEAHQVLPQESLETLLEIDLEARKLAT
jgi:1-deoxy-D-xylulose-5-phosphate reductoisomerase